MAYTTYITDAIVCGTYRRNTADASFLLFTRDLGMLFADARSVREERSRQRYALQDFSHIRVSLVKGKTGWKIGSTEILENFYHDATSRAGRGFVVSLTRFIRRFCQGEAHDTILYDNVIESFYFVMRDADVPPVFFQLIEVRLLVHLGYVPRSVMGDWHLWPLSDYHEQVVPYPDSALLDRLYTAAINASQL